MPVAGLLRPDEWVEGQHDEGQTREFRAVCVLNMVEPYS